MLTLTITKRHIILLLTVACGCVGGFWAVASTLGELRPTITAINGTPVSGTNEKVIQFEIEPIKVDINAGAKSEWQIAVNSKPVGKKETGPLRVDLPVLEFGLHTIAIESGGMSSELKLKTEKLIRITEVWDVTTRNEPRKNEGEVLLDSGTIAIKIGGADVDDRLILKRTPLGGVSTETLAQKTGKDDHVFQVAGLEPGSYQFNVTAIRKGKVSAESEPLKVRIINESGMNTPVITKYSNNPFLGMKANAGPGIAVKTYDGFLKLQGDGATHGALLKFRAYKASDNAKNTVALIAANPEVASNGKWEVHLRLPELREDVSSASPQEFMVEVFSERNGTKKPTTDDKRLKIKVGTPALKQKPTITEPTVNFRSNEPFQIIKGATTQDDSISDAAVLVGVDSNPAVISVGTVESDGSWATPATKFGSGPHKLRAQLAWGENLKGPASDPRGAFEIQTNSLKVESVVPPNFGTAPGVEQLVIQFSTENPVDGNTLSKSSIQLFKSGGTGVFIGAPSESILAKVATLGTADGDGNKIEFIPEQNRVVVSIGKLKPDVYQLRLVGTIKDQFGNFLEGKPGAPGTDYVQTLGKPDASGAEILSELPSVSKGVRDTDAPQVIYPEFTPPRPNPTGFNSGDRVETRVVRLYFYRDAHRIAQIVNRKAKSYNLASVETRRRIADAARDQAKVLTDERRAIERMAVEAAKDSRISEQNLRANQTKLQGLLEKKSGTSTNPPPGIDDEIAATRNRINELLLEVQAKRANEVRANEKSLDATAREDRAREDQFSKAVAAMREDPDTFAEGVPDSKDPVAQVSITVIGDAELQLRGPINGINVVRQMIHQIDSPAGQVRIGVHTVQINGERVDRMEKVATKIQDHLDQSRFLTQQSSLMLRKAIITVASRKAFEAGREFDLSQAGRDQKYMYAFFGHDFIQELRALDSEFLRSGNKMLSLHSMDTTSLASALFILALAKNNVRMEILAEFDRLIEQELPTAEIRYLESGQGCGNGCKHGRCHHICLLAPNARFQSFKGFFNANINGDDIMAPLQREFVRLAQIFKSQLVTELEVKQRVVERSLIEERIGNIEEKIQKQLKDEKDAEDKLRKIQEELKDVQATVSTSLFGVASGIDEMNGILQDLAIQIDVPKIEANLISLNEAKVANPRVSVSGMKQTLVFGLSTTKSIVVPNAPPVVVFFEPRDESAYLSSQIQLYEFLSQFDFRMEYEGLYKEATDKIDAMRKKRAEGVRIPIDDIVSTNTNLIKLGELVTRRLAGLNSKTNQLVAEMSSEKIDIARVVRYWNDVRSEILQDLKKGVGESLREKESLLDRAKRIVSPIDAKFNDLVRKGVEYQFAKTNAEKNRRPLDHKKLLDMLIDEAQDKNIELLEGTRAHTANVDNYIKRLATALEDDFNRQFYAPAFSEVRKASAFWDVTLGQIETTTILTNNRTFAKVEPQATMEFDLPRRDTVLTEAFSGAKGMIDTYGALIQDPSFLSLVKMRSGQPTSSTTGVNTGIPTMRNVLPGLSRGTDEQLLAQNGPGGQRFNSPLESLIPDPAIYKFETGTGFEIRPVIQPDGQAVTFHFNYMYTTNVREPVRADEKHLGRVKRHFIDTDVQLGNYELREVSRYQVALRAARTAKGVPLLQDIPGLGVLFRPLPSAESSLQQNLILAQATIYPTLFDLMGLRWAPAVADVDPLGLVNADFVVRQRKQELMNRVFDIGAKNVDDALRIPESNRRPDLYRTQQTIPYQHPNGYKGPGMNLRDSHLREGYDVRQLYPESQFVPSKDPDGRKEMAPYGPSGHGLMPSINGSPLFAPPIGVFETAPGMQLPPGSIPLPAPRPVAPGSTSRTIVTPLPFGAAGYSRP